MTKMTKQQAENYLQDKIAKGFTLGEELKIGAEFVKILAERDWTKFNPEQSVAWTKYLQASGVLAKAFADDPEQRLCAMAFLAEEMEWERR